MTFWIMLAVFVVLLPMVCFHRWHRPGDDWRERECLKCGERRYLILRKWERV